MLFTCLQMKLISCELFQQVFIIYFYSFICPCCPFLKCLVGVKIHINIFQLLSFNNLFFFPFFSYHCILYLFPLYMLSQDCNLKYIYKVINISTWSKITFPKWHFWKEWRRIRAMIKVRVHPHMLGRWLSQLLSLHLTLLASGSHKFMQMSSN